MSTRAGVEFDAGHVSSESNDQTVYAKIGWRLLPILLLSYMVAFLDRVNIGYAQLQMKETLPFGDAVYGFGAGIFFLGYFIFEVPSNLLLERIGARKTLLRIMVLWGLVAAATMFVTTPVQFYTARFLLGVFEAGYFPGVVLYFTYWYPSARRGQVIAIFMSATVVIGILAGPLCGAVLKYMDGLNGWHGWQWLFLVQGLPAAILGVILYLTLDDKPEQATWLNASEKALVRYRLDHDEKDIESEAEGSRLKAFSDPNVYLIALVYIMLLGATYAVVFWTPRLIQSWGVQDVLRVGLYAAVANAVGAIGMILIGGNSDRMHERRWHFVACVGIAALALGIMDLLQGDFAGSLVALSLATVGIASATPILVTLITEYFSAAAVAAGIALTSGLGQLGPLASTSLNGWILQKTGNGSYVIWIIVLMYVLAGALSLLAFRPAHERQTG
jgi:sugar phosphate permease